ncbi:hypothetical protein [Bradyrhizobium sp. BR13661]|jgi:hypothetical protein|uniref:hypothetical protein n=1 Tax=Bradyrhizobium sp. BR13661 TaxID=2940622 RepID=UPI0024755480|nr:hypothetical protein [Bradyrhizobium sp. BR13661]MDH6258339.1 hypothetical protein [Bradyrhizobium sp. BR13661]
MRWKISHHFQFGFGPHPKLHPKNHDPRTIDMLAIIALLTLVLGSGWYLAASLVRPPSTTAFIEPSQSVHW